MTYWWPVAASGRNSGVLYAGFYCLSDSLKAKLTGDGNRQLADYCDERGLGVNRCDKLVVAKNADEFPVLDEQLARAMKNGAELQEITAEEARETALRIRNAVSPAFACAMSFSEYTFQHFDTPTNQL